MCRCLSYKFNRYEQIIYSIAVYYKLMISYRFFQDLGHSFCLQLNNSAAKLSVCVYTRVLTSERKCTALR